jgi:hypothetical protein
MNYKFNITLNDKDYLDYNAFVLLKSYYGRKNMLSCKTAIAFIGIIVVIISLFGSGLSLNSFINTIPTILVTILIIALWNTFFVLTLKASVKSMRKSGKMPYSPESVMEFYDDFFVEITPENKNEVKYCAIERVSVIDCKVIYMHMNQSMGYIIPVAFSSDKEYENFIEFLKIKCTTIDVY